MSSFEIEYKKLLIQCIYNGELTSNRTNVKTLKLFNQVLNIDLMQGFPVITSKKIFFKKALAEFRWMFEGRTDLEYLKKNNVNWWNDFAVNNSLGKVYGHQIKNYNEHFNQINYVIKEIKENTRRAVITLWNPSDLKEQALPCCFTQFNFVRIGDKLNMSMSFRSSDLFLGLPYDIIVGTLFLITIANECNLKPNILGLNLADAHIYESHINNVKVYCENKMHKLPYLSGNYNDYKLNDYVSEQYIKTDLVK